MLTKAFSQVYYIIICPIDAVAIGWSFTVNKIFRKWFGKARRYVRNSVLGSFPP